jgi:hypothetical protein
MPRVAPVTSAIRPVAGGIDRDCSVCATMLSAPHVAACVPERQ